ncbi:MAG: outer membrane beta-barrel protein [Saprospiraceae bacterium]|nr:outer membrane beta-barrel protein [Saprospiraceae bacterium]
MKNLSFALLMLLSTLSYGQFEMGLKAGLSSMDLSPESILINNGESTTELSIREANYGYHFGLYTRISVANIFIEPAFLFNSSSVEYNLDEQIFDQGIFSTIKTETYNNLDIPFMVGMKMGFLRIQGGPVAHIFINSASELTAIDGYSQKFKDATYGFQGGIGLDLFKIRLDLNYETNLSRFGGDIDINGTPFQFDQRPARLVASLGLRF